MSRWINRSVDRQPEVSGSSAHTFSFTPATAGNLLVALGSGGVTFTTPTGWTLQASALGSTALYLWTKTATAGESSFSTTHNGAGYPAQATVYEFPAGTTFIDARGTGGLAYDADLTALTTVSSANFVMAAVSQTCGNGSPYAATADWSGVNENLDFALDFNATTLKDGYFFTAAYAEGWSGSTFQPGNVININGANKEAISFGLNVPASSGPRAVLVHSASKSSTTSPSLTIQNGGTGAAAAAGNLLVAWANSDATVSIGGSGWTLAATHVGGSGTYVWYKVADGTETSATFTPSAAVNTNAGLFEYSGLAAAPLDTAAVAYVDSSPASQTGPVSLTTTGASGDLVLAFSMTHFGGTPNPLWLDWTGGFQEFHNQTLVVGGPATHTHVAEYQGAAGSLTTQATWAPANATDRVMIAVAFKLASTGTPPSTGSGSGAYSFAGSGIGQRTPRGAASGGFAFGSSAIGARTPKGSASGALSFSSTGTGSRTPAGQGSGTELWSGSASGSRAPVGQASGTASWSGSGAGTASRSGSGTGSVSFASSGSGSASKGGSGSSAFAWAATGAGDRRPRGTGAGALAWAGAGTGLTPSMSGQKDIAVKAQEASTRWLGHATNRWEGRIADPDSA